jgi:hypothetical protein
MKAKRIERIISILREIVHLFNIKETDVSWSHYDTVDEAISDLESHIQRLQNGDLSCLHDLELLFAPTGSIQEISINSGWGNEFLNISDRFDKAIKKIT